MQQAHLAGVLTSLPLGYSEKWTWPEPGNRMKPPQEKNEQIALESHRPEAGLPLFPVVWPWANLPGPQFHRV